MELSGVTYHFSLNRIIGEYARTENTENPDVDRNSNLVVNEATRASDNEN